MGTLGLGILAWPVLIGLGLGLGIYGIAVPEFANAVLKGRATTAHVEPGLLAAAGGLVATLTALAVAVLAARRTGDERPLAELIRQNCYRAAALSTLPLVVALRSRLEAHRPWLTLAFCAAVGVLLAFSIFHFGGVRERELEPGKRGRWLAVSTLAALIATYAVVFSVLTIKNHLSFNTGRADLGIYVNIFRQSSLGTFLGCSLCGDAVHYTGGHFDPLLALLSPIFLIYPFAETILVLQALWLALGAIPVYLLVHHHLGQRGAAVAIAFAYLAFPALHGINCFDFHSLALGVPLLLALLYCFEIRAPRAYAITLILTLFVREDLPLALVGVGVYAIFSRYEHGPRYGWATLIASVTYFVVAKTFIMGRPDPLNAVEGAAGYSSFYSQLVPGGSSTRGLLGTLLTDPVFVLSIVFSEAKMTYVAELLVPLLALPLLGRGRVMLCYGAALTLLATRPYLPSVHFHYSSAHLPFLFVLTASALGRVGKAERIFGTHRKAQQAARSLAFAIAITTALVSWKFGAVVPNATFNGGFRPLMRHPSANELERAAALKDLSGTFPDDARVAANSRILTHLGRTKNIYLPAFRHGADYLVYRDAGRSQASLGRAIRKEIEAGYLVLDKQVADVNVYRTAYPKGYAAKEGREKRKKAPRTRAPRRRGKHPAPAPAPSAVELDEDDAEGE